jgi:hypothetical protein
MNWGGIFAKLARWMLFSVLFSLLPLTFNYLRLALDGGSLPSITPVIRGGELFLITASMCSVAIGDVIATSKTREIAKIISGGASLLLLATSTGFFVYFASKNGQLSESVILTSSLWVFGSAAISCAVCVAVK